MKRFKPFFAFLILLLNALVLSGFIDKKAEKQHEDVSNKIDNQAPTICIKTNEENNTIYLKQNEEFDINDYVIVLDNSNDFRLLGYGNVNTEKPGEFKLNLIAIDKSGNSSSKEVNIIIYSDDNHIIDHTKTMQKEAQVEIEKIALSAQRENFAKLTEEIGDIYELAKTYVGKVGQCTDIAQSFIRKVFNKDVSIYNVERINYSDAKPGDIIYYYDSGLGTQHYAVYLGSELALHGNFEGVAKIKSIYLKNGTDPIFFRLNALES